MRLFILVMHFLLQFWRGSLTGTLNHQSQFTYLIRRLKAGLTHCTLQLQSAGRIRCQKHC